MFRSRKSTVASTGGNKQMPEGMRLQFEPLGPSAVGKTAIYKGMYRALVQRGPLPSGLRFTVPNPQQMVEMIKDVEQHEDIIQKDRIVSTVYPKPTEWHLLQVGKRCLTVQYREAVGQTVWTGTNAEPDEEAQYQDLVTNIAAADVVLQVIPTPAKQHTSKDVDDLKNQVQLTTSLVMEALRRREDEARRKRETSHPIALACVFTKIDTRYDTEEEARGRMEAELLRWFGSMIRDIMDCPQIGQAAVIPTTAYGFGTAILKPDGGKEAIDPRWGQISRSSLKTWVLKPGISPRPYGLVTLMLWSLLAAIRQREIEVVGDQTPPIVQVGRKLRDDLRVLNSWWLPLKGE